MAKEFKPWMGHVPRDRGSVWYIAPLLSNILLTVVALAIVAAAFA